VLLISTHVGSAVALVLSGYAILKHTLGGAGRAPAPELASQILIILIGVWLLWRALRRRPHSHGQSAPLLAVATGLVPCPLTTFIMTYAVVHGAVQWGLLLSALFAAGMIVMVALFPLAAVITRTKLVSLMAQTEATRSRVALGLEAFAAIALIALGAWPLLGR
jgi:nickel/cobalt transporter (NicO) family protein